MKENYYFDNAATTWPKPEPVYAFMDSFFRSHGVSPGRAGHTLAIEAEQMVLETRRHLATFFGFNGDAQRVVFTQNATDSLNLALFGLLSKGDHVITTRVEHNSVIRPLNHLERDNDVKVTRLHADAEGYVDPDDIRNALRPETRVVVINHASNVLGAVQDLAAIAEVVRDHPAKLVLDTAQSAGVLPIAMSDLGIDVLTFTGHKGLFGPMGIGGLIVAQDVSLPPGRVGGTGVDSIAPFQPENYPYHLEAGTLNLSGIAGLHAAQEWFAKLGRDDASDSSLDHRTACVRALGRVEHQEVAHARRLFDALDAMTGVTVYGPRGNRPRVATLSFNIDAIPADQVGEMLDADHHLCVRAGLHCAPHVHEDLGTVAQKGAVRLSPGYFTDDDDIAQCIAGIAELSGNA